MCKLSSIKFDFIKVVPNTGAPEKGFGKGEIYNLVMK